MLKMQHFPFLAVPVVLQHFRVSAAWLWFLGWLWLFSGGYFSGEAELLVGEWFGNRI